MFIKYFLFQNTWLLPEPKIFCEDTQKLLESQSTGHWESTWLACVKSWISSHVLPQEGKWHKTLTSDFCGQGSQRLLLKQRLHGLHLATLWALSWCQQYCLGTKDFLPIVIIWNLEVIHLFLFSIYLLDIPKVISVWHCLQTLQICTYLIQTTSWGHSLLKITLLNDKAKRGDQANVSTVHSMLPIYVDLWTHLGKRWYKPNNANFLEETWGHYF